MGISYMYKIVDASPKDNADDSQLEKRQKDDEYQSFVPSIRTFSLNLEIKLLDTFPGFPSPIAR